MADADLERAQHACSGEDYEEDPHGSPMQLPPFRNDFELHRTKLSSEADKQREKK